MRISLLVDPHHTPNPRSGVFLYSDNAQRQEKVFFLTNKTEHDNHTQ
jgi:hypothetical protein